MMVVWLAPLASLATAAGGFIVRKRVMLVAGTLIVTYYDEVGNVIGEFIGQAAADAAEKEIKELGGSIVDDIGNATLQVIEGAGEALVKGLDRTFNYIGDRFIRGKEPDIVAGFTVTVLSILAVVYLYHSVKNANDAF